MRLFDADNATNAGPSITLNKRRPEAFDQPIERPA